MDDLKYIKTLVQKELKVQDLKIDSRKKVDVYARSIYYAICYRLKFIPYRSAIYINRDHATEINARKNHEATYMKDDTYKIMFYRCCRAYYLNTKIPLLTDEEVKDYNDVLIFIEPKNITEIRDIERSKYDRILDRVFSLPKEKIEEVFINRLIPYLNMNEN